MSYLLYSISNETVIVVPIVSTSGPGGEEALGAGKPVTVRKGAVNFQSLRQALLDENWAEVAKHLNPTKSLAEWLNLVTVACDGDQTDAASSVPLLATVDQSEHGTVVCLNGEPIPETLNLRMQKMATAGENPAPVLRFWSRLKKNPSYRSVKQLWDFMQHVGIPLTETGHLLAYKAVNADYSDKYTGKFDNHPGVVNEMPRNHISDDSDSACAYGFHIGSISYAQEYGGGCGRMVIVKVDPEHVVSVPKDESCRKMRVCKYEVVGEYGSVMPSTTIPDTDLPLAASGRPMTVTAYPLHDGDIDGDDDDGVNDKGGKIVDLMNKEADEGVHPVEPNKVEPAKELDDMGLAELMKVSISELREYATWTLKIVGASKIPGGKLALINRILAVREGK